MKNSCLPKTRVASPSVISSESTPPLPAGAEQDEKEVEESVNALEMVAEMTPPSPDVVREMDEKEEREMEREVPVT